MRPTPHYMPFGKHRGRNIESIDSGYLAWLTTQPEIRRKYVSLIEAVERLLAERSADQTAGTQGDCIIIPRPLFDRWFRRMTAEFHPDKRGGDCEPMRALNVARDELLALAVGGAN